MENKMISAFRRIFCSAKLSCLLFFFLLASGCSSANKQFSYFNMLDEHKRTVGNKQAAEKFWSSVRPISTLSDSHYRLGLHYQQKGKYDKAINEFAKALRNDPSYCKAYNGIAMSYDALRRCEPAHKSYASAVRCAPDQPYVYNNFGCSSLLCGDYAKGIELLNKAERLAGDNSRIKNNLKIARMVVNNGTFSDHLASRQEPLRVTDPEPAVSMAMSETSTKNSVADIPIAILPDTSPGTLTVNDPAAEKSNPSQPVEVSVERPLILSPEAAEAGSDSIATDFVTKEDNLAARLEPIPVSEPDPPASTAKNETGTITPVADVPAAIAPDIAPDTIAIIAPPAEFANPSPPAEIRIDKPMPFSSPQEPMASPTAIKILAEKTKNVISPKTTVAGVEVSNGNGTTGMAGRSAAFLRNHGFQVKRVTNAQHFRFEESVIFYREGYLQAAQEIAAIIPGSQTLRKIESMAKTSIGVRVLLGRDLVAMRFPDGFSGIAGFTGHENEDPIRNSVALAENSRQY